MAVASLDELRFLPITSSDDAVSVKEAWDLIPEDRLHMNWLDGSWDFDPSALEPNDTQYVLGDSYDSIVGLASVATYSTLDDFAQQSATLGMSVRRGEFDPKQLTTTPVFSEFSGEGTVAEVYLETFYITESHDEIADLLGVSVDELPEELTKFGMQADPKITAELLRRVKTLPHEILVLNVLDSDIQADEARILENEGFTPVCTYKFGSTEHKMYAMRNPLI